MKRNIRVRVVLEHMTTHEIKMVEVDFENICHGDSEMLDLELFNGYSGVWNIISTDLSTGKYDEHNKELFENDISYHGIVEWVENEDISAFQFRDFEYESLHDLEYLTCSIEILGNMHVNEDLAKKLRRELRCN